MIRCDQDFPFRVAVVHDSGNTVTKDWETYEQALRMYDAQGDRVSYKALYEWRDTGKGWNWNKRLSLAR